jgi:integrase
MKSTFQLKKVEGEDYLYRHPVSKMYYLRTKTSWESLGTTQIKAARKDRDEWVHKQARRNLGLAPEQEDLPRLLITEAVHDYVLSGFSSVHHNTIRKPGDKHIVTEELAVEKLNEYFEKAYTVELRAAKLDAYHTWRCENVKKGANGHRSTDLDLNTLSKSLDWAVRGEKLMANPIQKRTRYYNKNEARHAKDVGPSSTEEFHKVGAVLFSKQRSMVMGWQWMIDGVLGMRTRETVELRRDAKSASEPGFRMGRTMYSIPGKKDGSTRGFYLNDDALIILAAMDAWAKKFRPKSPYYFPGERGTKGHVGSGALTNYLERLVKSGRITRKLTAHGARAFKVLVERSRGKSDAEIAALLNQEGGVDTLQRSYGMIPPEWRGGEGPKMRFLPKNPKDYPWAKLFKIHGLKIRNKVPAV